MPEPVSITAVLAGTGVGMVVLNKMFDLLLTKWKVNGKGSYFTEHDRHTLQALGNAHLINAKDAKGRFKWWGGETTDAIKENTEVQREILAELKKQNGRR